MDFKKLAQFVMLAGLGVFAYGGYLYQQMEAKYQQEVEAADKQAASGRSMGFFGAVLAGGDAEARKQAAQKEKEVSQQAAIKWLVMGGAIILAGLGTGAAGKKPEPASQKNQRSTEDAAEPKNREV